MLRVVLFEPEIPANTGNIGRTCVGVGAELHLVGKLGFRLSDKYLKRSGLDYWPHLAWRRHENWEAFLEHAGPHAALYFFETGSHRTFWQAAYAPDGYLIFGPETRGFPSELLARYSDRVYTLPTTKNVRSLNLSSTAAAVIFEALRQNHEETKQWL